MSNRCVACRTEIEDEASKCVHCDSFQNWRRHLNISTSVLSLLVALTSVSAIVVPKIVETFHTPRSQLEIALTRAGPLQFDLVRVGGGADTVHENPRFLAIDVLVTNLGDAKGLLVDGTIALKRDGAPIATGRVYIGSEEAEIAPGAFGVVKLTGVIEAIEGDMPYQVSVAKGPVPPHVLVADGGTLTLRALESDASEAMFSFDLPAIYLGFE